MATATTTGSGTPSATPGGWATDAGEDISNATSDFVDSTFAYNAAGADATFAISIVTTVINLAALWGITVAGRGRGAGAGVGSGAGDSIFCNYRGALSTSQVGWADTSSTTIASATGGTDLPVGTVRGLALNDVSAIKMRLTTLQNLGLGYTTNAVRICEASVIVTYDDQPVVGMHPGF